MDYEIQEDCRVRIVNDQGEHVADVVTPEDAEFIVSALRFINVVPAIWRAGFLSGLCGKKDSPFGTANRNAHSLYSAGQTLGLAVRDGKITNTHIGVGIADRS